MELLDQIKDRARQLKNRIVLAEGTELRTLKAAEIVLKAVSYTHLTLPTNREV